MQLSDFGRKLTGEAGILQLMDDLGKAMAGQELTAMFGGGNPARIPAVTDALKKSLEATVRDDHKLAAMLGNYDTPQGNAAFIDTVVAFMNRHYQLGITAANVAVTPGSQTGYFMLFNLLAGPSNGARRRILFPLVPEYIGYADQGVAPEMFASVRPRIEKTGDHEFKYHIDFDGVEARLKKGDVAALGVSRPTNPSGNVVTDPEMARLGELAQKCDIPLLVDNAYGLPFPGVIKPKATLFWNDRTVLSISLSKVGLPSSRVGIFIGPAELMQALTSANAIVSLASPGIGQYIAEPLIRSDAILELSREVIQPYYFERATKARKLIDKHFPADLPWRLHRFEGSYFFWLWLDGAPVTSKQLYDRLKQRGVIVVPGEYFFPGLPAARAAWPHAKECLRLNFARPDAELEQGIPILAEEIARAYAAEPRTTRAKHLIIQK